MIGHNLTHSCWSLSVVSFFDKMYYYYQIYQIFQCFHNRVQTIEWADEAPAGMDTLLIFHGRLAAGKF